MDDDKSWKPLELEASVRSRFGQEQARRAALSIQSVAQRLEHADYHHRELTLYSEKIESESKRALITRMFASKDDELNEIVLKFSAHAIAGVQALHAVTDILGSIIHLSLAGEPEWGGNLIAAIRAQERPGDLNTLATELREHDDYRYLNELVNQSKHRNTVRSPFHVSISNGDPPRFKFESFERNGKKFQETDVLRFFGTELERQHDVVVRMGIELNKLAKEATLVERF